MIHEQIKKLRLEHNISRSDLAESLGISLSALGNYERGERVPDADLVVKFARYFNVTTDYLLGMSEHKTAEYEAVSKTIPLSDEAIDFIKDCPAELFPALDDFMSDENTAWFISAFEVQIASLDPVAASKVAEVLANQLEERGTSYAVPEAARLLAEKLTPAIQKTMLIDALNAVVESVKKRRSGACCSIGTAPNGEEKA